MCHSAVAQAGDFDVLRQHGQRHEHSARYRFSARASFFQSCVLLQSPTSSFVEIVVWDPRHRSRHLSRCFPQLSSQRPASRASRKQTVVEWCCSAFAESVTSGTAKALPHCTEHGYLFLFPSAKHLGQSPLWRSPEGFSCNNTRSQPAPSNCALALIPVMCWARTLTSPRI